MHTGVIGGTLGYQLLRRIGPRPQEDGQGRSYAYRERSKLETLLGPGIWRELAGKIVVDFGCGTGGEAIEVAQHGARAVIGLDIRPSVLKTAASATAALGLADRCRFVTDTDARADVVLSIDGLEHYDDPAGALRAMRRLVRDDGRVFIVFGPPWLHPLGGHLFSVFPWAHLLFTERALIRWRSDFKTDGATRFHEVEGGLNQMTVRRARALLEASPFTVERFEAVPIRRVRGVSRWLPRELFTSIVRCVLAPRAGTPATA
jgi:SAM-dependent methyltransferase